MNQKTARRILKEHFIEVEPEYYFENDYVGEMSIHCTDGELYFKPK